MSLLGLAFADYGPTNIRRCGSAVLASSAPLLPVFAGFPTVCGGRAVVCLRLLQHPPPWLGRSRRIALRSSGAARFR